MTPGFHDAHNHMAWYGLSLAEVDLRVPTLDALYDAVAARAADAPEGEWIVGAGLRREQARRPPRPGRARPGGAGPPGLAQAHLRAHVRGQRPAAGRPRPRRRAGRRARAGWSSPTAPDGRPACSRSRPSSCSTGWSSPTPSTPWSTRSSAPGEVYLSQGITSVVEAGVGGGWIGKSPVEVAAYQRALDLGRLPVRVELMVATDVLHALPRTSDDGIVLGLDLGIRTGLGDDRLRIGPVKIFSDGSLIGHTCAMTEDFADTPGERGYLQDDAAALHARILDAHRSGWRVAAHAIGDAAIDLVLDAVEEAQRRWPRPDVRHRIEHFGVSRPDQVARAAALGVVPVPQGRFVGEIGDGMLRALGPERAGLGLPLPLAARRRHHAAGQLRPARRRRRPAAAASTTWSTGAPTAALPCGPEEAITGLEALTAYTLGSAYASHAERDRGTIAVGKYADLAVLSDDPATVDPTAIRDIEVLHDRAGRRGGVGAMSRWSRRRRLTAEQRGTVRAIYEDAFPDELQVPFDDLFVDRMLVLLDEDGPAGFALVRDLAETRVDLPALLRRRPARARHRLGDVALADRAGSPPTGRTRLIWDVEDPDEAGLSPDAGRGAPAPDRLLRAARRPAAAGARLPAAARRRPRPAAAADGRARSADEPEPPLRELVETVYLRRYGVPADDPVVRRTLLASQLLQPENIRRVRLHRPQDLRLRSLA